MRIRLLFQRLGRKGGRAVILTAAAVALVAGQFAVAQVGAASSGRRVVADPTPSPSPTDEASPTPTPTPSASPSSDPSPTPSLSISPSMEPSPTPSSSPSPSPKPKPSPTPKAGPKALILASTVSPFTATDGSSESLEQQQAELDGFTVDVVDDSTWGGMSSSDFAKYRVIIIGDPTCADDPSFYAAAQANASTWEPVVMGSGGNKVVIGTDPTFHSDEQPGAITLERNGIAFAGAVGGATGAYVDLSCAYNNGLSDQPVPILDGLSSHGPGQFTADSPPCEGAIAIVAQTGPTSGLHDVDLSNWECSVHESFHTFPGDWTPLALATDAPLQNYCADDVDTGTLACGEPYIMIAGAGVVVSSDITLTPKTDSGVVGTDHTVTAHVEQGGSPSSGVHVDFSIDSGPDTGVTGSGTTNGSGDTTFTYTNNGSAGTDTITGSFTNDAGALEKATAEMTWNAPGADLSVTKTATPDPVLVDGVLAYTIVVKNHGTLDAAGVSLSDALPSGVTFKSDDTSQGSCSGPAGGTVTCDLGALANGASATVTITVTANATGKVKNSAVVSSDTSDPDMSNNTDSVTTTVNPVPGGGVQTGAGGLAARSAATATVAFIVLALAALLRRRAARA
jgi:uncharacterized repeat protein (TIGR01451 family)